MGCKGTTPARPAWDIEIHLSFARPIMSKQMKPPWQGKAPWDAEKHPTAGWTAAGLEQDPNMTLSCRLSQAKPGYQVRVSREKPHKSLQSIISKPENH